MPAGPGPGHPGRGSRASRRGWTPGGGMEGMEEAEGMDEVEEEGVEVCRRRHRPICTTQVFSPT